ncbi:hypothetical protein BDP81DRAFT_417007, partial [Colletotrichum phormii]
VWHVCVLFFFAFIQTSRHGISNFQSILLLLSKHRSSRETPRSIYPSAESQILLAINPPFVFRGYSSVSLSLGFSDHFYLSVTRNN